MYQPEALKSEEIHVWSRVPGVAAWAMLSAAYAGDLETVKALAGRDSKLLRVAYNYHEPLHMAARGNHLDIVKFLLEQGVDPHHEYAWPGDGKPLTIARDRGYTEMTAYLEERYETAVNFSLEAEPIEELIKAREVQKVLLALEAKPELVQARNEMGEQPIHWAVKTRQLGLINFLLENGADINARRLDGARPLDLTNGDYGYRGWRDVPAVAIQKHEVVFGYLLARGADYDISTAAKVGDYERVRELLEENPSLANAPAVYSTYYSGMPLRCAAAAGHLEIVRLLLEHGADPNQPEGIAPLGGALQSAISGKHLAVARLLLEHGANPNAPVDSSGNCFWIAQWAGAPQEMSELIASYGGVKGVEMTCHDGDIVTMAAMLHANPRLFIDEFALGSAFGNGNRQFMELILRFQPDILKTAYLSNAKNAEYARWLFEHGLDPRRTDWLGVTPLHRLATGNDIEQAQACLDFGADINAVDEEFCSTPLGYAARRGQRKMVEWLLAKGADAALPADKPWAQPLQWARRRGHEEIVELLVG